MPVIPRMHDWVLRTVIVNWEAGILTFELDAVSSTAAPKKLIVEGLKDLRLPRKRDWGPSASINGTYGPSEWGGWQHLRIEMQSGDQIEVIATSFELRDG